MTCALLFLFKQMNACYTPRNVGLSAVMAFPVTRTGFEQIWKEVLHHNTKVGISSQKTQCNQLVLWGRFKAFSLWEKEKKCFIQPSCWVSLFRQVLHCSFSPSLHQVCLWSVKPHHCPFPTFAGSWKFHWPILSLLAEGGIWLEDPGGRQPLDDWANRCIAILNVLP